MSLNRYVYTANNPLKYIDPTGHAYINSDGTVNWAYYEKHPDKFKADLEELADLYQIALIEIPERASTIQREVQFEALMNNFPEGDGRSGGWRSPKKSGIKITKNGIENESIRVGRWMGKEEYDLMLKTGKVQEGAGGLTYVIFPSDPDAFPQAKPGALYVTFDIPKETPLIQNNNKWFYMVGPTSTMARLREKRGMPRTELPPAKNIKLEKRKDKRE